MPVDHFVEALFPSVLIDWKTNHSCIRIYPCKITGKEYWMIRKYSLRPEEHQRRSRSVAGWIADAYCFIKFSVMLSHKSVWKSILFYTIDVFKIYRSQYLPGGRNLSMLLHNEHTYSQSHELKNRMVRYVLIQLQPSPLWQLLSSPTLLTSRQTVVFDIGSGSLRKRFFHRINCTWACYLEYKSSSEYKSVPSSQQKSAQTVGCQIYRRLLKTGRKWIPFFSSLSIKEVFAKAAPGVKTPPL